MVQAQKKIALLHRYQKNSIKETNAAFPYLEAKGIDVLTFKQFDRLGGFGKFWKGLLWIFYAPLLVIGRGYNVIYCDDSYPFYPALVKIASPRSKIVIRLGDLHLLYYYKGFAYEILHFFEEIGWSIADRIIVISEAMAERLIKEGYECEVVPDPVDPSDFPQEITQEEGSVMFHGVLTKNKNIGILLQAARLLPKVRFSIVGSGPDLRRLMDVAPSNVHFQGWVPFKDIHHQIGSCSVGIALRSDNPVNEYVVTSPFLQYGIMGKPCLVTRRKVFGDYKWQFSDVYQLATQIKGLLSDPDYLRSEGEKLRENIFKNHHANKIADQIWQILTQV